MATRFSHSTRIGARLDVVHATLADEAFWVDRIRTVGSPRDTLDDFALSGDTIDVTITQVIPESEIPDLARKVLPGELSLVRTTSYSAISDDCLTGTSRAEAVGGLGLITGSGETVAEGDEAVESLQGQVKVSIPLMAGKLEKMVVGHLDELFKAEHEHLGRWIAAR